MIYRGLESGWKALQGAGAGCRAARLMTALEAVVRPQARRRLQLLVPKRSSLRQRMRTNDDAARVKQAAGLPLSHHLLK